MNELLVPIHDIIKIDRDKIPDTPSWKSLAPYWPVSADKALGQWEAKVRLFDYLARAWGAISGESYRAWCSDLRIFFEWCRMYEMAALPAHPETVAAFIEDQAEIKSKATVRRYMASIAKAHKQAGVNNPVPQQVVDLTFQRLYRDDRSAPAQSAGLRWEHIERYEAATAKSTRLIDLRDRALVRLAYRGLLRQSEVARLVISDVSNDGAGWRLRVERSKKRSSNRQDIETFKLLIDEDVKLVNRWKEQAGITKGPLFRGVTLGGEVNADALSGQGVNRAIQRVAKLAGEDPENYSGHSCRIGAAQDMAAEGIDLGKIALSGDWESLSMPLYYCRKLLPDKGGMADLIRIQEKNHQQEVEGTE